VLMYQYKFLIKKQVWKQYILQWVQFPKL
jgi:hypothetical protein